MAYLNTTAFAFALKRRYSSDKVKNLTYRDNPFLAMVNKFEGFGGANFTEAVVYGDTPARSASFSVAQGLKSYSKGKAFLLTRVKDYSLASIDSETILASQGNENALLAAVKQEMDSALNVITRSLAIGMYGDGSGSLGSIKTSDLAVYEIELNRAEDACNFEEGMQVCTAASTAATPRVGGGSTVVYHTISSVNVDDGKITAAAKWSTTASDAAQNDVIFSKGDYATASDRNKITGLAGWLPSTAPTTVESPLFFGVDRGVHPTRLAGHRITGTGMPLKEALVKASARLGKVGGRPDTVFISYGKWEGLVNQLGSSVVYGDKEVAGIGFKSVKLAGAKGMIDIYPDMNCPSNVAYMLQLDTWTLRTLGPAPRVLDLDGVRMLRESSEDAYEVRVAYFGQLGCKAPGFNARISL